MYCFFYSLKLIKLKTYKTYIRTNLANNFIKFSKFFNNTFIFFIKKFDNNSYLSINYCYLNNLVKKISISYF